LAVDELIVAKTCRAVIDVAAAGTAIGDRTDDGTGQTVYRQNIALLAI
jgi:hypothetical protein